MHHFATTTTTLLLLLLVSLAADAKPLSAANLGLGRVIFSSVIFRHGDRAPEYPYPNDPYREETKYWPRGYGQLSSVGEEQHYILGTFLRKRYAHLLSLEYKVNETYVRSTDVDRTLVSARCNLAGLYPDLKTSVINKGINFQAIPIHTETLQNDILLKTYEVCPRHKRLLAQLKQSPEFQCVMQATAKVRDEVIKHTGHDEYQSDIYDILLVQETNKLPLPEWVTSYYPSPMKDLHLLDNFIAISGTTELQKLSAGPVLKKISEDMLDKVDGALSPDRSLFLYSAHDNNVVNILQSLKVYNGLLVPYASAVLIELRDKAGKHYVTVSYRNSTFGEAHLLQVPGCNALCPIDDFVRLIQPVLPDNIMAECSEELEDETEQDLQVPPAAIPEDWRHCFNQSQVDDVPNVVPIIYQ